MSLKKNISFNYIMQVFNIGLNFVYSLIIVKHLGAAGYGDFSIFYNSIAFAILLFGFNLQGIIVFFIANKLVEPGKLLFSSIIWIILVTIFVVILLLFSNDLQLAAHIFPEGNNKFIWIFFFAAMFSLLQINQILNGFLNANRIFIPVTFFSFLCNSLLIIFWLCVVYKLIVVTVTIFNLIWWTNITMNACVLFYSVWLIHKKVVADIFRKFLNFSEVKMLARFILIVYLCNTIQFLNYKMDVWFINYYRGDSQTGVYSLALSLSQLIWVLPNTISAVLVNYYQVRRKAYSIKIAISYGQFSFYFSCLTAFILSLIYSFALPLIYGAEFNKTFLLCIILFIGTIPFSLSIIIANLNAGIGFVKANLYATVFVFLIGVILDILIIPKYGITGAAIVKACVYNIGLLFQIVIARAWYQLPWVDLFKLPRLRNILNPEIAQ